jgi:hypothetical protein
MEGMRRKRSRTSIAGFASLSAIFALFVQLAPTLHSLTPHEEHKSSCTHASKSLHFEAAPREESPPCVICSQMVGRHAILTTIKVRIDGEVRALILPPAIRILPKDLVLALPDPRGPPPAL